MQALSDNQLKKVAKLIEDHHLAFLISVAGESVASPEEVARLKKAGLVTSTKHVPRDVFAFGVLTQALKKAHKENMSYAEFEEYLKENPLLLETEDKYAVKHLRRAFSNHVKGLGAAMTKATEQIFADCDQGLRRRLAMATKRELVSGIEKRKTVNEMATELRRATKDYARDWIKIASTETNNAFQEGRCQEIMKANQGRDPFVFKQPRKDCCDECRVLYLTKAGVPRLFRLSELVSNGSNVGKSASERKAVVGSTHPFCRCQISEMPPGFEFNAQGQMVYGGLEP